MDLDSSDTYFSPSNSPASSLRLSRKSPASHRNIDPNAEKLAAVAQKLHDALHTLKPTGKTKSHVSIAVSEFDNVLARAQQLALLTSGLAAAARRSDSRDDSEMALSVQISEMSDRISSQLTSLEAQLKNHNNIPGASISTTPAQQVQSVLSGTRHDTLYLQDGNLVIAAPSADGGTMLFRVHKSILALQSPVFAAMFTLPHPAGGNRDIYDGAPFVRMPDDAQALESLLKVLYNPSELPYKRLDPLTPLNVRQTLAMATKYEMDPLRNRIVAQLQADWPLSLAEWDRLEAEIQSMADEHDETDDATIDGLYMDDKLPEPCAAIRLALDLNIPKILPSALYHLSRLRLDEDWLEKHKDPADLGIDRTARWDLLEATDWKLLTKIREIIDGFAYNYDYAFTAAKACHAHEECKAGWRNILRQWDRANDPLDVTNEFVQTRPTHSLCKHCWTSNKSVVRQLRGNLWQEICECVGEYTGEEL